MAKKKAVTPQNKVVEHNETKVLRLLIRGVGASGYRVTDASLSNVFEHYTTLTAAKKDYRIIGTLSK